MIKEVEWLAHQLASQAFPQVYDWPKLAAANNLFNALALLPIRLSCGAVTSVDKCGGLIAITLLSSQEAALGVEAQIVSLVEIVGAKMNS